MNEERLYQLVGAKIRAVREQQRPKVSQQALAGRLNMTRASIVNMEAGRQRAPLHVLWHTAQILGVSLRELIPSVDEFAGLDAPLRLDQQTVNLIEAEANGNVRTRELLSQFIAGARNRNKQR